MLSSHFGSSWESAMRNVVWATGLLLQYGLAPCAWASMAPETATKVALWAYKLRACATEFWAIMLWETVSLV